MNRVLAVLCLVSLALASARCHTAPVEPSPLPKTAAPFAVPAVAGFWRGDFLVDTCIEHSYQRYACASFNRQRRYTLRLEQNGFEGSGSFSQGTSSFMTFVSDVSGHMEPDGALVLRGSRPAIDMFSDGADINALTLVFDKDHGLNGTFDYTTYYGAYYDPRDQQHDGSVSLKGHIQSASRQVWDPQPTWTGTWHGFYHVGTCTGGLYVGHCDDRQEGVHEFDLRLSDIGNAVSGELSFSGFIVPVTGSSTPSSIRLEGAAAQSGSSSRYTVRTFDWNVQRNGVDRLTGKISITETHVIPSYEMTFEAELVGVERVVP